MQAKPGEPLGESGFFVYIGASVDEDFCAGCVGMVKSRCDSSVTSSVLPLRKPKATAIRWLCPRMHCRLPSRTWYTSPVENPFVRAHSATETPLSSNTARISCKSRMKVADGMLSEAIKLISSFTSNLNEVCVLIDNIRFCSSFVSTIPYKLRFHSQ